MVTHLTPGPTGMHPDMQVFVRDAFEQEICSISHRSPEYSAIHEATASSVKKLLGVPDGFHLFYLSSATEGMERLIQNCVKKTSFHFVNGVFSKRLYETAEEVGRSPKKIEVPLGEGFDFSTVAIPDDVELICFTQNETSAGTMVPMERIYEVKRQYPDIPIVLDVVSASPYVTIDWTMIDGVFFSVQKGFRMPSGLGVLIVSDALVERHAALRAEGVLTGAYHSFSSLLAKEAKHQTPETPNIIGIYWLGRICDAYLEYGVEKLRKETGEAADALYTFFESHDEFTPFVRDPAIRSRTVPAMNAPKGSDDIVAALARKGFLIGRGYGKRKNEQIRIANFPLMAADVRKLLDAFSTIQ